MEIRMTELNITATTLVDGVMRRWPDTIRAFLDHRMGCPGCPIACFHTVADACREHHIETETFLRDLLLRAASPA
jgi:hybrid cluster-associated redox disulfide protein